MSTVVFAGGGMPLQKVLEASAGIRDVSIAAVFIDREADDELGRRCEARGLRVLDLGQLGPRAPTDVEIPPHDWFISVNSTVIFTRKVLALPRAGALNMHPGRLPDYAGLHTHQWAIRNGEEEFAATLHWMTEVVDAGPIAFVKRFPVRPRETGLSLFLKCLSAGAAVVIEALECIGAGKPIPRIEQDLRLRRVYRQADAGDGRIDWAQPAVAIERFVRAADYAPLTCPTYTPVTRLAGESVFVQKVVLSDASFTGEAGQIVRVAPAGVTVRAGDGRGVLVTHWKAAPGTTFRSDPDGRSAWREGAMLGR